MTGVGAEAERASSSAPARLSASRSSRAALSVTRMVTDPTETWTAPQLHRSILQLAVRTSVLMMCCRGGASSRAQEYHGWRPFRHRQARPLPPGPRSSLLMHRPRLVRRIEQRLFRAHRKPRNQNLESPQRPVAPATPTVTESSPHERGTNDRQRLANHDHPLQAQLQPPWAAQGIRANEPATGSACDPQNPLQARPFSSPWGPK